MEVPLESKQKIEQAFATISGVKSFTSFSRLTPDQTECVDLVIREKSRLIASKGRDRFLSQLIECITGTGDDEDEAINAAVFSQYRFYELYIYQFLYYPEKFDYLLRCVEERCVAVAKPMKFQSLIETILLASINQQEPLPDTVTRYDDLLREDEERRIESFTLRKDWVPQVPP